MTLQLPDMPRLDGSPVKRAKPLTVAKIPKKSEPEGELYLDAKPANMTPQQWERQNETVRRLCFALEIPCAYYGLDG